MRQRKISEAETPPSPAVALRRKMSGLRHSLDAAIFLFERKNPDAGRYTAATVARGLRELIQGLGEENERFNSLLEKAREAEKDVNSEEDPTEALGRLLLCLDAVDEEMAVLFPFRHRLFQWTRQAVGSERWRRPVLAAAGIFFLFLIGRYPYVRSHGLKGEYFGDTALSNLHTVRRDSVVDFDWRYAPPLPRFKKDDFSVRWSGYLKVPSDGWWEFVTESDDGVRLWIGDRLIIDDWRNHFAAKNGGRIELKKGWVPVRLEYFEGQLLASVKLLWKKNGEPAAHVIASRYLRPADRHE